MFLDYVVKNLLKSFGNAGRTRTRLNLLKRSDRFLADSGFSRELLEQGNKAWPWRIDDRSSTPGIPLTFGRISTHSPVPAMQQSHASRAKAVAELNAYSDAELSDLGIARLGIVEAVHHGRPGLDEAVMVSDDRKAA